MALRYDCKIVVEETIIPQHRDDLCVIKFFTNHYHVTEKGYHRTRIDCRGKMFCYRQANALVRQMIKDDPSLLGKYYPLRMSDPNFAVKRYLTRDYSELQVTVEYLSPYEPRKKEKPVEIPTCNLTEEQVEIDIAEMPDFDVNGDYDF